MADKKKYAKIKGGKVVAVWVYEEGRQPADLIEVPKPQGKRSFGVGDEWTEQGFRSRKETEEEAAEKQQKIRRRELRQAARRKLAKLAGLTPEEAEEYFGANAMPDVAAARARK